MSQIIVGMTGSTSGIGAAIARRLSLENYTVMEFGRREGFDLARTETVPAIVTRASDCAVFINCAHHAWAQTDLLFALFEKWRDTPRTILNVSSTSGDRVKANSYPYAIHKSALDLACTQLNNIGEARCRVMNLRPGWVRTPRLEGADIKDPMLEAEEVAEVVAWLLKLPPHVHVPSLTMVAKALDSERGSRA